MENERKDRFKKVAATKEHSLAYRRLKHKTQVFLILIMIIFAHGWSMWHMLNL